MIMMKIMKRKYMFSIDDTQPFAKHRTDSDTVTDADTVLYSNSNDLIVPV